MRKLLNPYSDIRSSGRPPYHHHVNARTLRQHFDEMGWDWSEYFKFTTVRNPWDRMVGRYHYGLKNRKSVWHEPARNAGSFPGFLADPFVSRVSPKSGLTYFACAKDGEYLLDRVLTLEELTTTLPEFFAQLGLPSPSVPHKNRSAHRHYSEYYDDETRELVTQWFPLDIEFGSYVFEQQADER